MIGPGETLPACASGLGLVYSGHKGVYQLHRLKEDGGEEREEREGPGGWRQWRRRSDYLTGACACNTRYSCLLHVTEP